MVRGLTQSLPYLYTFDPRLGSHQHMHPTWKEAFQLYRHALWDPPLDPDKKRLAKLSKRTFQSAETEIVRKKLNEELFSYDAFLRNLGRMSLSAFVTSENLLICSLSSDLEGRGGLYVLHSHLNHSCTPNLSVRHLHQSTNLSRISVIAKRDIAVGRLFFTGIRRAPPHPIVGEELFISYVDPALPIAARQHKLREWSFKCECERCKEEELIAGGEVGGVVPPTDLEEELKAGLGLF
jgi:hypothetical protein